MKNLLVVFPLVLSLLINKAQAQFFPSATADNRTGWSIGVKTQSTNCDVFDNGVDRLVTYVASDSTGMYSYVLVNDPVWGAVANYLPTNTRYHDIVISHSFGANHYILNVTYYDPTQGMILEQIDYYVGSGFSSSVITVLDSMLGNAMPSSGPHIDIDQENCHAVIIWKNPLQNVLKAVHLNFYLGLTIQSPINILPLSANTIEPDVAVTMESAYFTYLDNNRKNVYLMEMSLNDLDHNSGLFTTYLSLKTLNGYNHYNPRIATSCMNIQTHGDWTIVVGAGPCSSNAVYGWSGSRANIYTAKAINYTNSYTWINKLSNKYQMDKWNSLNMFPVVTYQHSNGNSSANTFQVAWQTTDNLNGYMGKVAGSNTITSVTCDNLGNPIVVASTNSTQPEFQMVPNFYSSGVMPPISATSGVNNFNSQSAISLAGRNSHTSTQLAVYFDAYNANINKPTWDEVLIKENVSTGGGFKLEAALNPATPISDPNITIFPNPVSSNINLHSANDLGSDLKMNVYDINGRLILNSYGTLLTLNNDLNVALPNLSAGTYLIAINSLNKDQSFSVKHKMIKVDQ